MPELRLQRRFGCYRSTKGCHAFHFEIILRHRFSGMLELQEHAAPAPEDAQGGNREWKWVAEPFFGCTGRLTTQRGTQPCRVVRLDGVVQT
jgi:hypothetical protein